MSSAHNYERDEYDEYNYEQDKLTGHGGKGKERVWLCSYVFLISATCCEGTSLILFVECCQKNTWEY